MREPAEPSNALALTRFVSIIALAFHTRSLRPAELDEIESDQLLRTRVDWPDDTFQLMLGEDAESRIGQCLRERVFPAWLRTRQRFTPTVPDLIDLPLDRFLPWLLEASANAYEALHDLGNKLDLGGSFERLLLEELQRMRPDLAERFRISGPHFFYKDRIEAHADFKLLADLYGGAAAIVSTTGEASGIAQAILSHREPPRSSALALAKIVKRFEGSYTVVGKSWPTNVAVSGGVIATKEDVQELLSVDVLEFFEPQWVVSRNAWSKVGLCRGNEDQDAFLQIALSAIRQLLGASMAAFGTIDVQLDLGLVPSDWTEVRESTGSNLSSSEKADPFGGPQRVVLTGNLQDFKDTFDRTTEQLERYLARQS